MLKLICYLLAVGIALSVFVVVKQKPAHRPPERTALVFYLEHASASDVESVSPQSLTVWFNHHSWDITNNVKQRCDSLRTAGPTNFTDTQAGRLCNPARAG